MTKKILSVILSLIMIITAFTPLSAFAGGENPQVKVSYEGSDVTYDIESNDITSALSSAFNYIRSLELLGEYGYDYVIDVPEGTYNVSMSLEVTSNTTVNLQGVTLVDTYSNVFFSPKDVNGYNGLHDFTVNGGVFTYPSGNTSNKGCLIRLSHAKNVTFNGSKFSNNYESHHVEIAACNNVVFDNCTFEGQTASIKNGSAEALQIDVLCEKHFVDMGNYDETVNNNITVKNCKFNNLVRGVGTHIGMQGKYQTNIKILNNTFNNCRATAISCFNYINTTVSGNKITNCGQGIMFYMMQNDSNIKLTEKSSSTAINTNCNSVIANNNISVIKTADESTPSPIYVFGNVVTAAKYSGIKAGNYLVGNIKVQNNVISTPEYGIRLFDTVNSVVSGNTVNTTVANNSRQGIILDDACKNVTVSGNKITKFKQGISVENSTNCVVQSNTFTTPAEHGVMVKSATGTTVKGNVVNTPGKTGVMSSGSKTTKIIGNRVNSPKSHGFGLISGAKDTEISSNIVTGTKANGVYIDEKSSVTNIKNNQFTTVTKHGICNFGKVSNISGNKFTSCKEFGIYIAPGASVSAVRPNTYSKNTKGNGYSKSASFKFGNMKKPAKPSLSSKKKTVTVKWKKVSGATGYIIYRSTSKNGKYTKVTTAKASATSYTNKKLTKGKTYYYKIVAINKKKGVTLYSADSAIKSIKCK